MHTFHIPVMGTGFTIDSPIKVAKYGISSVSQIGDDELCETMRKYYSEKFNFNYTPVKKTEEDYRAKRITAYLNLTDDIINQEIKIIKSLNFEEENDLTKYFELLPDDSTLKKKYNKMLKTTSPTEKREMQTSLKEKIVPGSIDVNIMTKVDKDNYDSKGNKLADIYSDALAALRGFAKSKLDSSVVFSAGLNMRLYSYASKFADFFPDKQGNIRKKIILKVSDFRSAQIQGKFFAKKGLWVSEYRVESGLNCGGHAFASKGDLLGPILQKFKDKKEQLLGELYETCNKALTKMEHIIFNDQPKASISVQGGIGTAKEDSFLRKFFNVEKTGWASSFLLVPESTTVDKKTLNLLTNAKKEDYFLSTYSPLGILFNTIKGTSSEKEINNKINNKKPGSSCPKKHLALFNTEFSEKPLCVASRAYQKQKIAELDSLSLDKESYQKAYDKIVNKACLCEDLAAGSLVSYNIDNKRPLNPAICPGPNLMYFKRIYSLKEMVGHIYGKINLLQNINRPNMFINELKMYLDYFTKDVKESLPKINPKTADQFNKFKNNLLEGIDYYKNLIPQMLEETNKYQNAFLNDLQNLKDELENFLKLHEQIFANQ